MSSSSSSNAGFLPGFGGSFLPFLGMGGRSSSSSMTSPSSSSNADFFDFSSSLPLNSPIPSSSGSSSGSFLPFLPFFGSSSSLPFRAFQSNSSSLSPSLTASFFDSSLASFAGFGFGLLSMPSGTVVSISTSVAFSMLSMFFSIVDSITPRFFR